MSCTIRYSWFDSVDRWNETIRGTIKIFDCLILEDDKEISENKWWFELNVRFEILEKLNSEIFWDIFFKWIYFIKF